MRPPLLAAIALLGAPATAVAQEISTEWSRVVVERWCHPDHPCTARPGLVWDNANPIPKYPPVMQAVGISGQAMVHFEVLPNGSVDPESVSLSSITNRAFERPTVESARQWRFGVEAPDRPIGPITVAMRIVYATPFTCRESATPGGAAWAPDGDSMQLIILAGCRPLVPRDQLRSTNPPGR